MLLLMRPPCMLSNIFVRVPGLQAPINVVFILALFWLFGMEACFLHRTSKRMAAFCFVERTVKRRRICNERRFLVFVRYRGASRSHAKAQGSFFYSHFSIVYRFKKERAMERLWVWKMFLRKSFSIVFPNPQTTNSNGEPISRRMGRWLRHRLSKHGRSFLYHGLQGIFNYHRFSWSCISVWLFVFGFWMHIYIYIYVSYSPWLFVLDFWSLVLDSWSLAPGRWLHDPWILVLDFGSCGCWSLTLGPWLLFL